MDIKKYALSVVGAYALVGTLIVGAGINDISKNSDLRQVQTLPSIDNFVKEACQKEIKTNNQNFQGALRMAGALAMLSPFVLGFGIPFSYHLFRGDMEYAPRGKEFIIDG